jgi:LPS-assembly lipoprotein
MRRRLLLAVAPAVLAGCGFELRRAPDFAFKSILITSGSAVSTDLRRNLSSVPEMQVLSLSARPDQAQVILDVPEERRERVVVGVNASGQVRELQLRIRMKFKLRTPQGKELIPETELLQQRDISFNETAVLAKEAEEGLLYRDMQNDLVQQLMRRLGAIKSL